MLRSYLTRLPPKRLDALRADLSAWRVFDFDIGTLYEIERLGVPKDVAVLGHCELQSTWDVLHFLLDPARREDKQADRRVHRRVPSTPGGAAVVGWHPMPDFCLDELDMYDYLPRYNTAEDVVEISAVLTDVSFEELRWEHSRSPGLQRTYSFAGRTIDEQLWVFVQDCFEEMRELYAAAASRGQAVLVTLD